MQPLIRDPVDYWILEGVLKYRQLLSQMRFRKEVMKDVIGWVPTNYDPREIVVRLLRLFEAGVLLADTEEDDEIAVTRDVILEEFRRHHEAASLPDDEGRRIWGRTDLIYFGLSHFGGKVWEHLVQPDWDRFVSDRMWSVDDDEEDDRYEGNIQTRSRGLGEIFLTHLGIHNREVIPGTVRETILRPWEATYWKTFSEGYEITCEARDREIRKAPPEWYLDLFFRWYTVPERLKTLSCHSQWSQW